VLIKGVWIPPFAGKVWTYIFELVSSGVVDLGLELAAVHDFLVLRKQLLLAFLQ